MPLRFHRLRMRTDAMNRLLPHPLLSVALWALWLMLVGSIAPGQLVLGAVLAAGIPFALAPWLGPRGKPLRNFRAITRLALVVLYDIVRSNVDVARRVLGPERAIRPAFVRVPLALNDARAIGVLAAIITMTPGTLTAEIAADCSHLTVHALHVDDPDALVADIKARYETPLKEIFE